MLTNPKTSIHIFEPGTAINAFPDGQEDSSDDEPSEPSPTDGDDA